MFVSVSACEQAKLKAVKSFGERISQILVVMQE